MEDSTPILVGCGQVTDLTTPVEQARSPFDLMAQAGRLALADGGAAELAAAIDVVAVLRLFSDTSHRFATKLGASRNPPRSVADRLGLSAARAVYTHSGGNMPQFLVNAYAAAIAAGEIRAVLIAGGEALRTQSALERAGACDRWNEDPGGQPEVVGDARRAWSDVEDRHQMRAAIVMYPLIENAIRAARGASIGDHLGSMALLFAGLSRVAAQNPLAARREAHAPQRLATIDEQNRWIAFPYPRLMNAYPYVDQAAALVVTSVGEARRRNVPETQWVFLHGCADGHDRWHVSERGTLAASPAIRAATGRALDMAGQSLDAIELFDLYSCFPAAVEIACQEIGLDARDPRGLTVTGGLPYFGGAGNSYALHSIAEMMCRLRARRGAFGLVTALGNYVTKHSIGIYSTRPLAGRWQREDPGVLQRALDAETPCPFVERASGRASIETYTIVHGKKGPESGILLGRLHEGGTRFVANTPPDAPLLADLQERDSLGRHGTVTCHDGRNLFVPD